MQNSRISGVIPADGALIDAFCDEFEAALKSDASPRIEDFLSRLDNSLRPAAFRELLQVEVEVRRYRGEMVRADDYLQRFPEFQRTVEDACRESDVVLGTASFDDANCPCEAELDTKSRHDTDTGRGQLEVRCPNCHAPMEVAIDTALTDLSCPACGSEFSLVNETNAELAAPLATMGRFELISRLGMGAFGSVWKARDKELDRTVAIKIPRARGTTAEDQEKFFREARAAAQLRHPNIVSVHEVGRDGDSVYIVSDFVRGMTLSDWLADHQPTSREAAELCAKIAAALDHAHELGVVHRDLKPANIMIDNAGQPHIMDFGLARREVGEVTVTLEGHILGTPAYMSPEQAQGESHKADRRSDVYSLGVILFQLLTRELPFRGNARMLMQQVIHDEPPSPRKLNASISKDLETITLKCLEKLPNRRYRSAGDLAAELRRYLAREPILARPVSRAERSVRWVRRNKTVSAVSAVAILALVGGTIASTLFGVDARRQAAAALAAAKTAQERESETTAVLDFVEDKIFAAARPQGQEGGLGANISLKKAMEAALPYVETGFPEKPLIEARLRETLGISFHYLGEAKIAADQHGKSRAIYSRQFGPEHPRTLASAYNLALEYGGLGQHEQAAELHKQTLEIRKRVLGPYHHDTLWSADMLAGCYLELGRQDEALHLYEETLALRKEKLGSESADTIAGMNNLASAYYALGQFKKASELFAEARNLMEAKFGPDHPNTLGAMNNLAAAYQSLGRFEDALKLQEQTLALQIDKLGPDHPHTLASMDNLARTYNALGRRDDAVTLGEKTLAHMKAKFGSEHPSTLKAMNSWANCCLSLGKYTESARLREEVLTIQKTKLGPEHPDTLGSMNDLAGTYHAMGKYEQALLLHEQAFALRTEKLGAEHADTLASRFNIAGCLASLGRFKEAVAILEEVLAIQKRILGPDHVDTTAAMFNLAGCYHGLGRFDEAVDMFEKSLAIRKEKFGAEHPETLMNMGNLAGCYAAVGRHVDAAKLLEETLALQKKMLAPDHPNTLMTMDNLAVCYDALGKHEEAIQLNAKSLELQKVKLGPDHPHVLTSMSNLAGSYTDVGRHAEAAKLREELLVLRRSKLGAEHPDTLDTMHDLAHSLAKADRVAESVPLFEASQKARMKALGPSHSDSIEWTGCLMSAYYTVGRTKDILPLLEATLAAQRKQLGSDDQTTIDSMNALARMMATSPLDDLRNGTRAVELATEACELTKHRNPALVDTLAAAYAESGDYESAIKSSQSALELLRKGDDTQLRVDITKALESYKAEKPLRGEAPSDVHQRVDANDSVRPSAKRGSARSGT